MNYFLWDKKKDELWNIKDPGCKANTDLLANRARAKVLRKMKFDYVLTFIMNSIFS